jgi:hypothetical protein
MAVMSFFPMLRYFRLANFTNSKETDYVLDSFISSFTSFLFLAAMLLNWHRSAFSNRHAD